MPADSPSNPAPLQTVVGVSSPRSGHHLLVRLLSGYFGSRFRYCEFYNPQDCCKTVPCSWNEVTFSKNHDYDSSVPILSNLNYLIQYRRFLPHVVSNFELHLRNNGRDTFSEFRSFARNSAEKYRTFMQRWSKAQPAGSTFILISYERLTEAPLEAMDAALKLFAPQEPVDSARLAALIGSVDRITVAGRSPQVQRQAGVRAQRDIRAFRYYDEKLFRSLEESTRSAYETMAALPIARTFAKPKSLSAVRSAGGPARHVFVDATGMLSQAGQEPTGIPRVQDFIIRSALADSDGDVDVVLFDKALNAYRAVTDQERRLLSSPESRATLADKAPNFVLQTHRALQENPYLDRKFERSVAARASGGTTGLRYNAIKVAVRAHRSTHQLLHGLAGSGGGGKLRIAPERGVVLLSHMAIFGSVFPRIKHAAERTAFVCHDLIPWLYPSFVTDKRHAERFVAHLRSLLQNGAQPLCTSETSLGMLRRFISDMRVAEAREPERFHLPSSLRERADRAGSDPSLAPARPFVVYCSTIEVRKNHLLLARVWQKAREEGVPLPLLVCAGQEGWGTEELRAFMRANPGLSQDIRFVGPVSDSQLVDLYRKALFGVVPSRVEGWGFGISECLDFGLPVIVSASVVEAARDLMPALDPDDVDGWYAEIRRLAEDGEALKVLRDRIAASYKPTPESESWSTIKALLRG